MQACTKKEFLDYVNHALVVFVDCCLDNYIEVSASAVRNAVVNHGARRRYEVTIKQEESGFMLFIESMTTE